VAAKSMAHFRVTDGLAGPCLRPGGPDGGDRFVPLAPEMLPAARRLVGAPHGAADAPGTDTWGGFRAAALAQLARFALYDEGTLSRHVNYDSLLAENAPPARPREVSLIVTKLCNLRCLHCYNDSGLRDPRELGADDKLRLVSYLGRWGVRIITLTGGEPTIDSVFPEILDIARRYRMRVKISTNAWHVSQALTKAIKDGTVIQLSVSLDGADAATHDTFRGRDGSFDRVIASLRTLGGCRPKTIVLSSAIHRGSLTQMEALASFAAEQCVDVLAFKPVTFTGRRGIDAPFLLGHADVAEFARTRDRLQAAYRGQLVIDGKLTGDDVPPELQEDLHCQAAHSSMVIKADGTMLPCDTLTGVPGAPDFRSVTPMTAWLAHPVFTWFRGIRDHSSGGCGTSGCPGMKVSKQLVATGADDASAPFIPVQQLFRRR
jgi:MoaA/NifB/PqqE/SkfB family radical SAM enzyme